VAIKPKRALIAAPHLKSERIPSPSIYIVADDPRKDGVHFCRVKFKNKKKKKKKKTVRITTISQYLLAIQSRKRNGMSETRIKERLECRSSHIEKWPLDA